MVHDISACLDLAASDPAVKVVVLKGAGDAFCAGADLAYLQTLQQFSLEENLEDSQRLKSLFERIYSFPKVIIAQVQGAALAGGCGLATLCDFTIASANAKFGYTEVRIGFIPALVSVFLVRKIGEGRARQLLLSGEVLRAEEALANGLLFKVVPPEQLEEEVKALADRLIRNNSGTAMTLTKHLLADISTSNLNEGLTRAAEMNAQARMTDNCKQGIAAFLAKKDLNW